jgi:CDP-2,3-bis-(O-geranylgeranyl)-sn-glycerol synthase
LNRKFVDGKRILGDGKTFVGFIFGVLVGTLVGFLQGNLLLGFLLSFGTMFGDSVGSFVKRRLKIKRGKDFPLIDQLFFLIFALIFAWSVTSLELIQIIELIIVTPFLHRLTNIIAYYLKLKRVPW